jgi:hypothetical protein
MRTIIEFELKAHLVIDFFSVGYQSVTKIIASLVIK